MYIDYNNLYDEVKLYIKEHYKPGQYLFEKDFEKDLVNYFMINEKEAKDIMFDLYLDYVLDKVYIKNVQIVIIQITKNMFMQNLYKRLL